MNHPIYDTQRISDFAADGTDSVDSEDFDPGYGCVVAERRTLPKPLPLPIDNRTEAQRESDRSNEEAWSKRFF